MGPSEHAPLHARRSSSGRARVLMAALAALLILTALGGGLAFAERATTDSSHVAAASATSLSTPIPTAAEVWPTAVRISWSANSQPVGTTYVVVRNPGAGQVTVCTVPASASACTDHGLKPATLYSYAVGAVVHSWRSSAATVSFTTAAVHIASPSDGATLGSDWGGSISGTSSPATGATVSNVEVSVQQGSGSCWSGAGNDWSAACPNFVATSGPVGNWTLSLPSGDLNAANTYHITAQATDSANIAAQTTASATYDTTAPTPAAPVASAPNHETDSNGVDWVGAGTVTLTDTVAASGAGRVSSVAYYYCPTSVVCTASSGTRVGNGSGANWSYTWTARNRPASGSPYEIVAVATDSRSDVGTSPGIQIGFGWPSPSFDPGATGSS